PTGVGVDDRGNVYITDYTQYRVVQVDARGTLRNVAGNSDSAFYGDEGLAVLAALNNPRGVAVGPDGMLFIADSGNYRVRSVTPDALIHTVAGNGHFRFAGDNGPALSATLYRPEAIAIDNKGNLYISEGVQNRVRRVTPDGVISVYAGTGEAGY